MVLGYIKISTIEPVETKENLRIEELVIVVDTSYSTSGELVQKVFEGNIYDIVRDRQLFQKEKDTYNTV